MMDINTALCIITYMVSTILLLVLLSVEILIRPRWKQYCLSKFDKLRKGVSRKNQLSFDSTSDTVSSRKHYIIEADPEHPEHLRQNITVRSSQSSSSVGLKPEKSVIDLPAKVEYKAEIHEHEGSDSHKVENTEINLRKRKIINDPGTNVRHSIFAGDLHVAPGMSCEVVPPPESQTNKAIRSSLTNLKSLRLQCGKGSETTFLNRYIVPSRDKTNHKTQMKLVPPPPPIERIPSMNRKQSCSGDCIIPYEISVGDQSMVKNGKNLTSPEIEELASGNKECSTYVEMMPLSSNAPTPMTCTESIEKKINQIEQF